MNTRISYQYRDADNYKFHHEAVVKGEITKEQIEAILSCLDDGEYFIPAQVGLPCTYATGYGFDETSDHPFCELDGSGFDPTEAEPTADIDAEALVEAFRKAAGHWSMPGTDKAWPASNGSSTSRADAIAGEILKSVRNGACAEAVTDGKA